MILLKKFRRQTKKKVDSILLVLSQISLKTQPLGGDWAPFGFELDLDELTDFQEPDKPNKEIEEYAKLFFNEEGNLKGEDYRKYNFLGYFKDVDLSLKIWMTASN